MGITEKKSLGWVIKFGLSHSGLFSRESFSLGNAGLCESLWSPFGLTLASRPARLPRGHRASSLPPLVIIAVLTPKISIVPPEIEQFLSLIRLRFKIIGINGTTARPSPSRRDHSLQGIVIWRSVFKSPGQRGDRSSGRTK